MSQTLTVNEVTVFDAEVKQEYQRGHKLGGTTRVRTNVTGKTVQFPKYGKGLAKRRIPSAEVEVMNVQNTNVQATLLDWIAAEYTDIYDQQKVNYEERAELAQAIAMAMGRRKDQIIIDSIDAAATSLQVANSVGGNTGLNTGKFRQAQFLLDDQGVPEEDRYMLISARGKEQLMGDTDADTFDKNVIKMLVRGEINVWLGFTIKWVETRAEGGLPLSGSDRTSFAWHKAAVGIAEGKDVTTKIDWIGNRTSWLAAGYLISGGVAIEANGIVDIATVES